MGSIPYWDSSRYRTGGVFELAYRLPRQATGNIRSSHANKQVATINGDIGYPWTVEIGMGLATTLLPVSVVTIVFILIHFFCKPQR